MNRPETEGFQKPLRPVERRHVGLATMKDNPEVCAIECSCGWLSFHRRKKVRDNNAERHVDSRHDGRAIWL